MPSHFAWWGSGLLTVGLSTAALAQGQPVVIPPQYPQMPGREVGSPIVMPIGQRPGTSLPQVGTGPGGIPNALSPFGARPNGAPVELKNVIAPYPGMPKPEPSFWDKLEERWMKLFESDTPAVRPSVFVPGISRRNKARAEERQRWQWN